MRLWASFSYSYVIFFLFILEVFEVLEPPANLNQFVPMYLLDLVVLIIHVRGGEDKRIRQVGESFGLSALS